MLEFFKGTVTPKDWAAVGGIVGFTVVLVAAFYFLMLSPQKEHYAELEAQDQQLLANLSTARETEKNIDVLRAEAGKIAKLVEEFEQRLPDSQEIPMLLKQFEGFANDIGLQVELSMMPTITDEKKETIPYMVTAKGSFHQIVMFMNRLERFQRYLKISGVTIGEEKEGVSQATFTLSTFRIIQQADKANQTAKAGSAAGGKKS